MAWSFGSVLFGYLVNFARSIILARLLAPDDYGLFGLALTVLGAISTLTQMGLDASILAQRFSNETELHTHLNTVWTVELVRRVFVTLLLLAAVYPAALFYGDTRLYPVLAFLSLTPLIQGFQNVGLLLLHKEMNFRRLALFDQVANLLGTLATVSLAFWTRNVWALVFSLLLSTVLSAGLSYRFHSYRPRFAFDREAFRKAFTFGKYVFVMSILGYILTTADNILIGKLLGTAVLGAYLVAYNLANLPVGIIGSVVSRVTFPAYTELGGDTKDRLDQAFVKVFTFGSALLVLVNVPVMLLANEIVLLVYGAKWAMAGSVLRILTLLGFLRGHLYIFSPYFLSVRGAAPEAKAKVFETIVFLSLLYPLTKNFGIEGAAWAGVVAYAIGFFNRFLSFRQLAEGAARKVSVIFAKVIVTGALGILCGAVGMITLQGALPRIIVTGSLSMAVMFALLYRTLVVFRHEIMEILGRLKAAL